MISKERAYKIGMDACEQRLGATFSKNKRLSSRSYGETPNGFFCFIGVDDDKPKVDGLKLTADKFPHYASCFVDMQSGDVVWDKCVLEDA